MNHLLTANDPGDTTTVGGTLHALPRADVTCYNCGARIFVFCFSITCAACCFVLQANGGLVCEESPVFLVLRFSWKLDGLTDEDKCDTV